LALNVPNDGFELVNVPPGILGNMDAKVRIQAVGNIFFDVSDNTFEISSAALNCITYTSTDVPISIPTSPATVFSDLPISDTDTIITLKVLNVTGTHTFVSNLVFTLVNPTGDELKLLDGECGSQNDFDMSFSDTGDAVTCPLDQSLEYESLAPLSSNYGNPANGLWRLKIEDTVDQVGGELSSWAIEICYISSCPSNLVFDSGDIATGNYYASQSITASVPAQAAANILMRSMELDFEGGFEIPSGTLFEVELGGCP
jgi:subtilisin-like proprotein convertase family protein